MRMLVGILEQKRNPEKQDHDTHSNNGIAAKQPLDDGV